MVQKVGISPLVYTLFLVIFCLLALKLLRGRMNATKRENLERIIFEHEISHLIHFTHISNLDSILSHGIVPYSTIKTSDNIHSVGTSDPRLDGNKEATSCSLDEPNLSLMNKRWRNLGEQAILVISTKVILEKICAFFPKNASRKEYQYKSKSSLCTHWAFEKMFSNVDGFLEEDAEVQVFGDIETEYFEQVCIYSDVQRLKYSKKYADVCFIGFMDRWK